MLVALSDGGWVAVGVISTAAATVMTAIISLFNRKEQKQTRHELAEAFEGNSLDHGNVARALSRLYETVEENHRRNGERFQRLGERMGDIAARQEKTIDRIDDTNARIDDVLKSQRDHLQHHLEDGR